MSLQVMNKLGKCIEFIWGKYWYTLVRVWRWVWGRRLLLGPTPHWFYSPIVLNYTYQATFTHARRGCGAEAGGFWHSRSATAGMFTHMRSKRGRFCHFLRTMMVWSVRFRSGRGKLGVGPISCGVDIAPAPLPLRDCACVSACNDLCWSQFFACLRPRQLRACVNVPSF